MEGRHYIVFDCNEIYKIDFNQVIEKTPDALRKSVNGLKTFVKYEGEKPSSLYNLITGQEYTYDEIIVILKTEEWTSPLSP